MSAGKFTNGIYNLVSEAITEAANSEGDEADDEPAENHDQEVDLEPYVGTYSAQPWGSETAVVQWKGDLALMSIPTNDPVEALTELRHDEADVFYRVRSDDERGEDVIFHRDDRGQVVSFSQHGNFSRRLR